jgi:hypothetical protein
VRCLQLLIGLVTFTIAPVLCGVAASHGWHLLRGFQTKHWQLSVGALTFSDWPCVGILGGAGILLAIGGYYVFFPPEERRR